MRIAALVRDENLQRSLHEAAAALSAELVDGGPTLVEAKDSPTTADVLVVELNPDEDLDRYRVLARRVGAGLVAAFHPPIVMTAERIAQTDEWVVLPVEASELVNRISIAKQRATGNTGPRRSKEAAELMRYEELLYDRLTGFPTLPVMIRAERPG